MHIPSNILKYYLKDVYFFCGTSCGGKTTISKAFAEKHGLYWLDENALNQQMAQVATSEYQPMWCSNPPEVDLFNRPPQEFHQFLRDCGNEMLPLVLMELIRRSATQKVAVDMYNMPPNLALEIVAPNRIVFLVTTPERIVQDCYNRPGHTHLSEVIQGMPDPNKTRANCDAVLRIGAMHYLEELKHSGLYSIMRDDTSSIAHTLALVETHFGV